MSGGMSVPAVILLLTSLDGGLDEQSTAYAGAMDR
jgi:hypothetical protein